MCITYLMENEIGVLHINLKKAIESYKKESDAYLIVSEDGEIIESNNMHLLLEKQYEREKNKHKYSYQASNLAIALGIW